MRLSRRHEGPDPAMSDGPDAVVGADLTGSPDGFERAEEHAQSSQLPSSHEPASTPPTSTPPTSAPVLILAAVNLLPRTYALRAEVRRAKLVAAIVVCIALLILLFAWLVVRQKEATAQEALDVATSERAQLQSEAAKYADVPRVFAAVTAAESQISLAMGSEVRWSFFLNDLALTMPSGVSLDTLLVSSPKPGAAVGAAAPSAASSSSISSGATGAGVPGIGTMTVTAKALTYDTVSNWLDSLAKLPTLSDPYVDNIAAAVEEGTDVVTYSSTATITRESLSQRYTAEESRP